jgi:DNA-binding GntR family transcriptional regulator
MELVQVGTKRAYDAIRTKIVTLELPPGAPINEQALAEELEMPLAPVREALKLLIHNSLVGATPRHGLAVTEVSIPDLEQLSETRLTLEALSAQLAARRATGDDRAVLAALSQELASTAADDNRRLLELDHRFHQAVAKAAHNKYLAEALERLFGLSQRLWYLALPRLGFLPSAVEEHRALVEAIGRGDPERAGELMHDHVAEFYANVRTVLGEEGDEAHRL